MENKNGQGIFLGVVGVATLIVAIIGATFAFFSAQATGGEGNLTGNTLDVSSAAISIEVSPKKNVGGSLTGTRQSLVPAVMTESVAGYNAAVSQHCENEGYTGCHVFEVKVTTDAATTADIKGNLTLSGDNNPTFANWRYVLVSQTNHAQATETEGVISPTFATIDSGTSKVFGSEQMLIDDASLPSGDTYYYLIVYLSNTDASQNGGEGANDTDETGTYSGTLTLSAAGGQVKATFNVT